MANQNLNSYTRECSKTPKVIVESVKSDTTYSPLWMNDLCNNVELKKSLFSRYYLNNARLNSVFSMTEKELQDTTEIVMHLVNSLYGDSIAQQLGLTNDIIFKYPSTVNKNTVDPEEALRNWNIKDYMAMGNSYPYNCVFNLLENDPPLGLTNQKLATSECSNLFNTLSFTNNMKENDTIDKLGYCHHLNLTRNKEPQTKDNISVRNENNCRVEPLVSLEVATFANGKFANINCLNKTNESSIQKRKLFFAFTEYQKLLNVFQQMATVRTGNVSLQGSENIIENKCNAFFIFNTECNRNVNFRNNVAQASCKKNLENFFTYTNMTKTSNLICERNFESKSCDQKYCKTTYTSTETKPNAFKPNVTPIYSGNESQLVSRNSTFGCSQRYPEMNATLLKKSQVKSLQQNKLLIKRAAPRRFIECKDYDTILLNMRNQINSKVTVTETKRNKTLESQTNKFQSGSVLKKILTTRNRNVRVIHSAPFTTTPVKKCAQTANKKKNYRDGKKLGTKGITGDHLLENTKDVINWIEENTDTLNTVQCYKSIKEIEEDLLRGVSNCEKENNNVNMNKSVNNKSRTEKKYFNKRSLKNVEKLNYETKIPEAGGTHSNDNMMQLIQKSHTEKSIQVEVPKNEIKQENEKSENVTCQETFSTEEDSCPNVNKSGQNKTIQSPEDCTEHHINDVPVEGTVFLPNFNEDNKQKAYPYNLRKRKPVVYFYPTVYRRVVSNRECNVAKKQKKN